MNGMIGRATAGVLRHLDRQPSSVLAGLAMFSVYLCMMGVVMRVVQLS